MAKLNRVAQVTMMDTVCT